MSKCEEIQLQAFVWSSCNQLLLEEAHLSYPGDPKGAASPCSVHAKIKYAVHLKFFFKTPTVQHKARYKINSDLQ